MQYDNIINLTFANSNDNNYYVIAQYNTKYTEYILLYIHTC